MKIKPETLKRANNVLWTEPTRWQGNLLIYRAIIWGSQEQITFKELITLWKTKARQVDISVMLANVINESQRMPYIARYEVGQHYDNDKFMGGQYFKDASEEFECTSFGLFQPMGFHLIPKYIKTKQENIFGEFTIQKQLDWFDDFMFARFQEARNLFKTLDAIVYGAIAGYAGSPYWHSWIIDKKFKTWQKITAKDSLFLKSVGFTDEEIKLLYA